MIPGIASLSIALLLLFAVASSIIGSSIAHDVTSLSQDSVETDCKNHLTTIKWDGTKQLSQIEKFSISWKMDPKDSQIMLYMDVEVSSPLTWYAFVNK